MDDKTSRRWGAGVAAGAVGIAALVALSGEPKPPRAGETPTVEAPSTAPAPQPSPDVGTDTPSVPPRGPAVTVESTDGTPNADALNPNLEFIVKFEGAHPLARAQAQYAAGDADAAEASARAAMANASALKGLCFSKFTLGAETVLAHCARVPNSQLKAVSDRWTRRLRTMRNVDYADPNVILQNENPVRSK